MSVEIEARTELLMDSDKLAKTVMDVVRDVAAHRLSLVIEYIVRSKIEPLLTERDMLRQAMQEAITELKSPAAEYVPAMPVAWGILEAALAKSN